jgi:hypothetical protein
VQTGAHNVFECAATSCKAVQTATPGGTNEARCTQNAKKPAKQECTVEQANDTGTNTTDITQTTSVSSAKSAVSQSSAQAISVTQRNGAGTNSLGVHQTVAQSARGSGTKKHSHVQEAIETVTAQQTSGSGHQTITIEQTQDLRSQMKGSARSIQRQNSSGNGPDLSTDVLQHAGSGRNDLSVRQTQLLSQRVSTRRSMQAQGADDGGETFTGDIDADASAGGFSAVTVQQSKTWTQNAPSGASQSQTDKLRVRTRGLTPDTVDVDQSSSLSSGSDSGQRCSEEAEVHARENGTADQSCSVQAGNDPPETQEEHREGQDFTTENQIDNSAGAPTPTPTSTATAVAP